MKSLFAVLTLLIVMQQALTQRYQGNQGHPGNQGNQGNPGYPDNQGNPSYPDNQGNQGNPDYPGSPGYPGGPGGNQGPSRPKCPRGGPNCICPPQDWKPVCSTQGCTYPNNCQLSCVNQTFAYKGRCRRPYGGYGYGPAAAPAKPVPFTN